MYTFAPFFRYCSATLQRPSLKITTRCHSVFSLRSPVVLSRQFSDVAMLRLAIGRPSCVRRISGSLPRFPTRITLFTLPAIAALHSTGLTETFGLKPPTFATQRRKTYTPAHRADQARSRQYRRYPHIASPLEMFQFCSTQLPVTSANGISEAWNRLEPAQDLARGLNSQPNH